MKKQIAIFALLSITVIALTALVYGKTKAEPYVIYNENRYIITTFRIKPELVGDEIATVKNKAAAKGKNGYSNALEDGTRLYAIIGEDTNAPKVIAYKNSEYYKLLALPGQHLDLSGYIEEPDPFIPNKNEEQ